MPDDNAMNSLLAAVEVAAATSTPAPTSLQSFQPSSNLIPTTSIPLPLSPIAPPPPLPPPPPPPLPPQLPSPPPLPPIPQPPVITIREASPPSETHSCKRKGARIFSSDEKRVLEANYARNKFPSRLHMQTLARAMGKPTEKVRTWYNNRRAFDRKLGHDVQRNAAHSVSLASSPATPFAPASPTAVPTNPPIEEPVILPSRVIASPVLPPAHGLSAAKPRGTDVDDAAQLKNHIDESGMVNVTPSAIAWAPSVSPVTAPRQDLTATTPPPSASNRFRLSPLRIRNGKLAMGTMEICGQVSESADRDQGLEVKFLFGKKKVVYEWYCGDNFADERNTGGPYAKMEMNFASVHAMQLVKEGPNSILHLTFSTPATLFLQTPESMDKYKVRSQQRQYRKVSIDEFPIRVISNQHRIWMRTEDAVRISKILMEDVPVLRTSPQPWSPNPNADIVTAATPQPAIPVGKRNEDAAAAAVAAAAPISFATPAAPRNSVSPPFDPRPHFAESGDSIRRITSQVSAPLSRHVHAALETSGQSYRPQLSALYAESEVPIVRHTTAAGAAANLLNSPVPWQSPTTPFMSIVRPRPDESSMRWLPSDPGMTPLGDRSNLQETPNNAAKVRRELNFNNISNHYAGAATSHSPTRKRKASNDVLGDDGDENDFSRRRLNEDRTVIKLQPLRIKPTDEHVSLQATVSERQETLPSTAKREIRTMKPEILSESGVKIEPPPR